jgi:hypothetical protein
MSLCTAYQEDLIANEFLRVGAKCANESCQFPITSHSHRQAQPLTLLSLTLLIFSANSILLALTFLILVTTLTLLIFSANSILLALTFLILVPMACYCH